MKFGTADSRSYKYESLVADVDYAATRVGVDAKLQQSPTEFITAKGSVPTTLFQGSTETGHVAETAGDQVDLQITSTALNLGVIQGFTNQVTNVTGTLEADVRVTGSGQDPHLRGFIDIKGGAFGVPAGGVSYRGLDTRIELEPDRVRLQKFTVLDEHNEPLHVSGELAVHERQIGGVNVNIDSDNFEVIDNELGDVGVDSKLQITGELRRPHVVGEVRLEAARIEVDRVLESFYDPYAVESLPDVVSAERHRRSERERRGCGQTGVAEGSVVGRAVHGRGGKRKDDGCDQRRVRAGEPRRAPRSSPTTSCCVGRNCAPAARTARRSAT